jgi:muramidase (phage lysozyme)
METCSCGAALKQFWIWRDVKQVPHASAFQPAIQSEVSVFAANARDALAPIQGSQVSKHDVREVGGTRSWLGSCAEETEKAS